MPDQIHSSHKEGKSAKSHSNAISFRGTQQPARDVDCVLLWDEEQQAYVLHALESVFSFKLDRSHTTLSKKAKAALENAEGQPQPSELEHHDEKKREMEERSPKRPRSESFVKDGGQENREQHLNSETPDTSPSKQDDSSKRSAPPPPFKLKLKPNSSSRSGSRAGSPHVASDPKKSPAKATVALHQSRIVTTSSDKSPSSSKHGDTSLTMSPSTSTTTADKDGETEKDDDEEMELFAAMLEQKVEEPPTPLEPVPGHTLQMAQEARTNSAPSGELASRKRAAQRGTLRSPGGAEGSADSGTGSSGEGGRSSSQSNKRPKLDLGSSKIKALGGLSRRKEEDGLSDSD